MLVSADNEGLREDLEGFLMEYAETEERCQELITSIMCVLIAFPPPRHPSCRLSPARFWSYMAVSRPARPPACRCKICFGHIRTAGTNANRHSL